MACLSASRKHGKSVLRQEQVATLSLQGGCEDGGHVHVWRLSAWVVSGVAYAAHIGYEHLRLRSSARAAASHAALAVAVGALALAVAGMIRSLATTSAVRPAWLLALVVWPAVTAVPAFLVALLAGALLARIRPL
jgi:hypothetical protein